MGDQKSMMDSDLDRTILDELYPEVEGVVCYTESATMRWQGVRTTPLYKAQRILCCTGC
jgi:hypothetical protein